MNKFIFMDNRMREFERNYLKNMGYEFIEIPTNNNIYNEISSHVDIFVTKINDKLFVEPTLYHWLQKKGINNKNIISGRFSVKAKYPFDIPYNLCQIGNNVIHNFKYTDPIILDYINEQGLNKININQGYSNCSIAVISENSAIVTDKKIAKKLENNNIDVLCISKKLDIKLLTDLNEYSNMKGFIGGCISRLQNKIIFWGDLNNIKDKKNIIEFIDKKNLELIEFKKSELIDYGGVVDIILKL